MAKYRDISDFANTTLGRCLKLVGHANEVFAALPKDQKKIPKELAGAITNLEIP